MRGVRRVWGNESDSLMGEAGRFGGGGPLSFCGARAREAYARERRRGLAGRRAGTNEGVSHVFRPVAPVPAAEAAGAPRRLRTLRPLLEVRRRHLPLPRLPHHGAGRLLPPTPRPRIRPLTLDGSRPMPFQTTCRVFCKNP